MPVIALVALLAALTIADPDFLTQRSLTAAIRTSAPLVVLAAGATLVVLCGGIDLSIAALCSLSTVFFAMWLPDLGGLTILVVVAAAGAIGAVQGIAHVVLRIPSFVVTLGGMSIFSAVALVISDAGPIRVIDRDATEVAQPLRRRLRPDVVLRGGARGRGDLARSSSSRPLESFVRATGYSESAARLAGTPVDAVKVAAFTISGACAGLAAVMLASRNFSGSPTMADNLLLPAVAAIVVGGTAITGRPRLPVAQPRRCARGDAAARRSADRRRPVGLGADPLRRDHRDRRRAHPRPIQGADHQVAEPPSPLTYDHP